MNGRAAEGSGSQTRGIIHRARWRPRLLMTTLPIAARHERLGRELAERWHLAVIAYAEGVLVLIGFQLVSVLSIA